MGKDGSVKVYTTETTYDEIFQDFLDKYLGMPGISYSELEQIHRKWKSIGKLAKAGKLTGMKY